MTLNRLNAAFLSAVLAVSLLSSGMVPASAKQAPQAPAKNGKQIAKPAAKPASAADKAKEPAAEDKTVYAPVDVMALLKEPAKYLDKPVQLEGTFNRFSDIALDYKKAFRDSRDYVSFMILRPDVTVHSIPLSELKLFYSRKKSDDVTELESGDKITIKGKVFSTALDEPWLDVSHIEITKKAKEKEAAKKPAS